MSNDESRYNLEVIRNLLLAAFSPEELRRFCYDRPDFRPVVNRFGPSHGLDDMVDEFITYCDNYRFFPELLAELHKHNPRQYAHFIDPELSVHEPALPTLEISTVRHPISLLLVRVPAGEFQMGSVMSRDQLAEDDELPPYPVHIPEFHIGKYPVTNSQYETFVQATGHSTPYHWEDGRIPWDKDNHPVVHVTWHNAVEFCDWLGAETGQSFRLPTEAEWEKAARGTDGRIFPWGDDQPTEDRCNFGSTIDDTTPIGRYSPQGDSPYGCADMAGNVLDWCQSLYRSYPYHTGDGREATEANGDRMLRGGAFRFDERLVRCAFRGKLDPDRGHNFMGFRVVIAPGTSDL